MKEPTTLLSDGIRITTHDVLGSVTGILVSPRCLAARKPHVNGTLRGWVPGHGGDVYWVEHEDKTVAAYGWWEFELNNRREEMGNTIKKVHLLIIDPQHDFCDKSGALPVQGAWDDMNVRLPAMIRRLGGKLDDIHVTLDCHHLVDVAHPVMWKDTKGNHPSPFTIITGSDVESGKWSPVMPSLTRRFLAYTKALEQSGKYPLCIWPPHCLIGSPGNAVVPELFAALREWEQKNFAMVDFVSKGSNIYTEHYSAVKAEVPDPDDPSTHVNTKLIQTLMEADVLAIAGEAGSHCLANTVRDIATEFGNDAYVAKMVLLTDATSPVGGFEHFQDAFVKEMVSRGMQLSTTKDFLA